MKDLNQTEFVDIIDENGGVLRSVPKPEAHRSGLLHKCVVSEVVDSKNRWLLVKQASDRQDAGLYVSPVGGHIKSGESEIDALKREAEEELGIRGDIKYESVGQAVFNREVLGRKENHVFVMFKIFTDAEPVLNHESESCKYFTESELKSELLEHPERFGKAFHFVVDKFFSNLL